MSAVFTLDEVLSATAGRLHGEPLPGVTFSSVSTDTRALGSGALFVALVGERFDGHMFLAEAAKQGAAAALVQSGVTLPAGVPSSLRLIAVEDTLVALGRLARHHRRRFSIPIGAITGSNGKTTTKEMVAAILETGGPALKTQGNLNNEIGVPLTLFRLEPTHTAAVIEMGMNHLGEIARLTAITEPDAGLITVVQAAHLEGLGTIDNVGKAKGELFHGLSERATAVVNLEDPRIVAQAKSSGRRMLTFGRGPDAAVRLVEASSRGAEGQLLKISHQGMTHEVPLHFLGDHNALNATGAFALALALGFSAERCAQGLSRARPHDRRLQLVPAQHGVQVLDDCYNANPSSMAAALETLATQAVAAGGRAIAVLGDMLELGAEEARAHRELGERTAAVAPVAAFFGPRSAAAAEAARTHIDSAHFTDMDALLAWLMPRLKEKDTVLVKGSRGMRLERVVQALTGTAAAGDGHL